MKKLLAMLFALASGVVLFIPDMLPFIDEAVALMILVKSLQVLGVDISRFIPFMKSGKKPAAKDKDGPVVDV
ncbi:hypothetical protein [Haloferula sargassicola]|uniref:DUF1232 domain-containing protein n=1 Tax=Haloferula sargassicola TaxID=490096 RepID=A0ABP9UM31_9BACT